MNGLNTTVQDYDTALKAIPWGDGVTYASVIDKRCNARMPSVNGTACSK